MYYPTFTQVYIFFKWYLFFHERGLFFLLLFCLMCYENGTFDRFSYKSLFLGCFIPSFWRIYTPAFVRSGPVCQCHYFETYILFVEEPWNRTRHLRPDNMRNADASKQPMALYRLKEAGLLYRAMRKYPVICIPKNDMWAIAFISWPIHSSSFSGNCSKQVKCRRTYERCRPSHACLKVPSIAVRICWVSRVFWRQW